VAHLSLSLLGTLEVKVDNQPVTAPITGKARALLAYLAVEADRQVAEALAGLLWPDWPARSARANLRNALSNLRKAIGDRDAEPPFLLVTWETIQLNRAGDCWVDAWTFGELVQGTETHPMEQAITLYRGPFLQGFSVADSPAFEDWVLVVRERLERQVLEVLQSLTAYDEERGAYARAREHAQRRVEVAPWQEQAHQDLMRLLALSGQPTSTTRTCAARTWRTCPTTTRSLRRGRRGTTEALRNVLQRGNARSALTALQEWPSVRSVGVSVLSDSQRDGVRARFHQTASTAPPTLLVGRSGS
jgi:DNA-binding SARP family transcriptional activator